MASSNPRVFCLCDLSCVSGSFYFMLCCILPATTALQETNMSVSEHLRIHIQNSVVPVVVKIFCYSLYFSCAQQYIELSEK